jgi:hypothetical protein
VQDRESVSGGIHVLGHLKHARGQAVMHSSQPLQRSMSITSGPRGSLIAPSLRVQAGPLADRLAAALISAQDTSAPQHLDRVLTE